MDSVEGIDFQQFAEPFVIKNKIESWKCRHWKLPEWSNFFGRRKVKFRLGILENMSCQPMWEANCDHEEGILEDLQQWMLNDERPTNKLPKLADNCKNKLMQYGANYWCYADYIHLGKVFVNEPIEELLNWKDIGLNGQTIKDSTLWIGSKGANTPCHQDSYGFNVVAQLQGRKNWTLFAPDDGHCLYPTRIPYEESSIYSSVNVQNPDTKLFPLFKKCQPYCVTLEPGDVLYVPHHFWHFVESLESSISINTWVPLDVDNHCRLQEAIVRSTMSAFINSSKDSSWLNPNEELFDNETNFEFIRQALKSLETVNKKRKTYDEDVTSKSKPHEMLSRFKDCRIVARRNFDEIFVQPQEVNTVEDVPLSNEDIMRCITHPTIVNLIAEKIKSIRTND